MGIEGMALEELPRAAYTVPAVVMAVLYVVGSRGGRHTDPSLPAAVLALGAVVFLVIATGQQDAVIEGAAAAVAEARADAAGLAARVAVP